MAVTPIIDETIIRQTITTLKPDGQFFEVRIVYNNKKTLSGYFNDADTLLMALERDVMDFSDCNFYITLQRLNPKCANRSQYEKFLRADATTSDTDVEGYDWLMVDLDPKRPTKTSSTDEDIQNAWDVTSKIYRFMQNVGFNDPIIAFSGNGYHLLYKIQLGNREENKRLIEKCLKTLNMLFSDENVDVDMKNFNPSRVCKLYGTKAQKGLDTETAPHRMSCIIQTPFEIKPTDRAYIEKLSDYYPQEEKPQRYNNYRPRDFNLQDWLDKHHIIYEKTGFSGGDKYILEHCPFDENHKGKDAVIFQSTDGRIGFNCFHNSCADKKWRDVRLLYEPDAYEKRQQDYEKRIYSKSKVQKEYRKIEAKDGSPVFLTARQILNRPKTEERFIRTGTTGVDKKLRGLKVGGTSVLSGLRGSAKSTWISEIVLECCENDNKVGVFSGELSADNFMRWMNLQAAGKGHVEPTQYENWYNVPRKFQEQIADWMGDRFYLYNNEYGNDYQAVKEEFHKKVEEDHLELLILDNLMAFNISSLSDNKFEAQTAFVWSLHEMAMQMGIHIMFVAHPRKSFGFLRLDDISGTADIGNAVDDAFIIHRNNNDFQRLSKQMFGWREDNDIYKATNVIEIAKDRDSGNQDIFIPLWYEVESKRLKNNPTENKIYGWDKSADEFSPLVGDPVFD